MRSLLSLPYPSQPSPSVGAGIGGAVLHEDRYVRSHESCSLVTVTIPGLFSLEHQLAGRPSHKMLRTVRMASRLLGSHLSKTFFDSTCSEETKATRAAGRDIRLCATVGWNLHIGLVYYIPVRRH